ncbi:MAG: hypothetical protein KDA58_06715 [Planctomycetaceae bacterium]|nr:hypothetical protein [Planctomycetaceae bacterium]
MRLPLDELERRLQSLVTERQELSDRMLSVATELETHRTVPSWEFVDDLKLYRQRFGDLQTELNGGATDGEITTLTDLKERLAAEREREVRDELLALARTICHVDGDSHPVTEQIRTVLDDTTVAAVTEGSQLAGVRDLLRLITDGDSLSDEDWNTARLGASERFGNDVAVAAARGKLILDN